MLPKPPLPRVVVLSSVLSLNVTGSETTVLYLSGSGRVGIGTTSPETTLEVSGTVLATGAITGSNGLAITGSARFKDEAEFAASADFLTSVRTPLIEYTDGDDAITIADGGVVTFAAAITGSAGMVVTGSTRFKDEAEFAAATDFLTSVRTPLIEYTDGDDAMTIADGGSVTFAAAITGSNGMVLTGSAKFNNEVEFAGNVGIGTTSPTQALDVSGSVRVRDRIITSGSIELEANKNIQFGNSETTIYGDGTTLVLSSSAVQVTGSIQFKDGITINQGAIDGTPIGESDSSTGTFTTITGSSGMVMSGSAKFADEVEVAGDASFSADLNLNPSASSTAHITTEGSVRLRASANIYIGDDGADSIRLGRSNTTAAKVHVRSGADTDLVVSNSKVGIGTDSPSELLHLKSSADKKPELLIENSNSNEFSAVLRFYKSTTDEAASDQLGLIYFTGKDAADADATMAWIVGKAKTVDSGAEEGALHFGVASAGAATYSTLSLVGTGDANSYNALFGDPAQSTSSTKIGVHTSSPAKMLDINAKGSADGIQLTWDDADGSATDYATITVEDTNGKLKIATVDSDGEAGHIALMPDGNVGVGVASPSSKLEIDGDLKFSPTAISTAHVTTEGSIRIRASANIYIGDDGADSIRLGRTNTTAAKVHIRSGADTDLVVSNSKVGIGTEDPSAALEIDGDIKLTPSASTTAHITTAGSMRIRAENAMYIGDNGADSVRIGRTNTTAAKIHIRSGADTDLVVSNSKVGIGTDSPDAALHVAGAAAFSGPSETFVTFSSSDTTPSVSTGNLFKTHASAQTLTDFDDGVAGQTITVISTAAVVFDVTSSGLKGGSTNITTASGDITVWTYDGTDWFLVQFMDVSANLSSPGGSSAVTALNNATANELVTVGSTTTELDAESNLTFDGSTLTVTGHQLPGADNTYDLGSSSYRYRNIYTGDLHLRNERGDWTILEEEDFLCVINNKTGKKYEMMLKPLDED